jgi:uncharacterized protein
MCTYIWACPAQARAEQQTQEGWGEVDVTLLAASALGVVIGLVLGALGGGGGVLTVPVLVYALGETPANATTGSLVIVGIAAAVGALARRGTGSVAWRAGLVFGVIGIPAAYLGTVVNQRLDPAVLLLTFALLILAVAVTLLAGNRRSTTTETDTPRHGAAGPDGAVALSSVRTRPAVDVAKVVASALAVGFLTGLLGVGGGFLIVPALVIALRMPMPTAIGTSLLVITVNSAASLLARAATIHVDWSVVGPFTLAAVLATVIGKRVADRFSGRALTRAFAFLLIAVAAFVTFQSVQALT